ncbi:probable serine/threonine-protein kinase At1g54610 isoform X2 [Prosopis cineraria]|uniref:probable serine/threonine-protein kinase At1g54610 isoform X2 n=1 Tax=Prosopis cineraria TaxID=364024 RepID=UPI00240F8510|nr:probable serine/threonine-protein kinase At1g54610 isoform X2 [Prosopis cineraria]XP_054794906.1 probable serine/threonine-protein kinase At1g54610 isoform X2 [Prosopis cineraria]XP_054822579.1 probable serine/threonine-protein kinase At1g54610 isoform X2 [Prosopis cineraria]
MGCVLGVARDDAGRRAGSGARNRREQNCAADGGNAVRVGSEGTAKEKQRTGQHGGEFVDQFPGPERRKPSLDPCAQTQQGWPSWLMAVAGDAIRDWAPRRANTFEKLAKVKCYMKQLLSGLEHCHSKGVLHRDIKGSNLLIDDEGILKIADFGLAAFYDPEHKQPMTSRVVTLWYRAPELLLGATYYGVGIDLWSAGCILGELLNGKPIMPGRTEVEQLHKIFKLCGSPSEDYWKKFKLPNATLFRPQQPYKRCILETFKDFPPSSVHLISTLLSIDPDDRGRALAALNSDFFTTEPYACEPSSLPKYPPSKELDIKLRDEEARRQKALNGKHNAIDGAKRVRVRDRGRAIPAPEANAEIQSNLDRWRVVTHANAKSKSEKFPPPHQDGAVGYPLGASHKGPVSFGATETDASFSSAIFNSKPAGPCRGKKTKKTDSSWKLMRPFK